MTRIRHFEEYFRDPLDLGDHAAAFRLQPEATAAGVRDGDIVAGVEGRPLKGITDYYSAVRRARRGDRLNLQLGAGSASAAVKTVSIELQPLQLLAASRVLAFLFTALFVVVMPLFCLALGFWVAAVRVGDRAAWLLLVLMLSISVLVNQSARTMFGRSDPLQPLLTAYVVFFSNIAPVALVLFAIAFPDRLAFDRRHPWVSSTRSGRTGRHRRGRSSIASSAQPMPSLPGLRSTTT